MSSDSLRKDVLLAVIAEYGAAMRERSQPEYLYTAASLAGFGAVCWGVATLDLRLYEKRLWTHPALDAAFGIFIIAFCVAIKIVREHRRYKYFRRERSIAAQLLTRIPDVEDLVPKDLLNGNTGPGAYYSLAVVIGSAFASVLFCLVMFFGN